MKRLLAAFLLLATPLLSGWWAGLPEGFSQMPVVSVYIHVPEYSAPLYLILCTMLAAVALALIAPQRLGFGQRRDRVRAGLPWEFTPSPGHRFPVRGWAGTALVAAGWTAAWWPPEWLGLAADHTFFPLWLGYVLTVDGMVQRRAGASPMTRLRGAWLAWFPASALTWWYFEFINRFIQNWVYLGVEDMSVPRFILGSTLAFSTVIPAVLTTAALLSTFPRFRCGFITRRFRVDRARGRIWAWLVAGGVLGLALVPWFPIPLFALIWIAPLLILVGMLETAGLDTGTGHLLRGDWRPLATLAAAALVCGFFWELWNWHAMPKWIYQVPWVNRFHLFEMPVVGYLGYLPFGPACWAFWLLWSGESTR